MLPQHLKYPPKRREYRQHSSLSNPEILGRTDSNRIAEPRNTARRVLAVLAVYLYLQFVGPTQTPIDREADDRNENTYNTVLNSWCGPSTILLRLWFKSEALVLEDRPFCAWLRNLYVGSIALSVLIPLVHRKKESIHKSCQYRYKVWTRVRVRTTVPYAKIGTCNW